MQAIKPFAWFLTIVALAFPVSLVRGQSDPEAEKPTEEPATVTAKPVGETTDASTASPPAETVSPPPEPAKEAESPKVDEDKNWFVPPRASGMKRETIPPYFVQSLDKTGLESLKDVNWFDFGIEQRTRFDRRDDSYLQPDLRSDDPFLMRSRAYMGFREILDPFRMAFELQDSRQFNSDFPDTNRDANQADILQAYGELYFKDAIDAGAPLRFRFGRMTLDMVDRRLVGRNSFRNTTNAFDGFHLQLGETRSLWQVDTFAARPVERRLTAMDGPDDERWLYGLVGAWRGWSEFITLEPYYLVLDADRKVASDREIHTIGLRGYGIFAEDFDYDVDAAFQTGGDGGRDHRAFAVHGQLGYTFNHEWQPRVAVLCNYASGDANPADNVIEQFDTLYGDSHTHYGYTDMFNWSNLINPAIQLSFKPWERVYVESFYRAYWLAADSDAWFPVGRRDPTGESGDFIGHEIDFSVKYQVHRRLDVEVGYAYFMPGEFVENTGPADDLDVFYVQTTLRF